MSSADFFQMLAAGLATGSIYMLMANGLFMTHLTTGTLNFGQGDFLMIAAFIGMAFMKAGLSPLVAIAAVLLAVGVLGVLLERIAIRPLERLEGRGSGILAWILTTAGFGLIIENVATLAWGKSSQYAPPLFGSRTENVVSFLGVNFYIEELAIAVVAFCVVGVLYYFLYRTRYGRSIAAVAFNRDVAALLGVNVRSAIVVCFVIMALLAATAGVLVAPITTVHPHMGLIYTLKGFVVLNIGGFTNPLGVLVAGLLFGIAEAFCNYYDSAFGDLYPFIFIIAFLAIRPTGLFAEARADIR
jgi:branched-chain amino acid transport system permease protein